MIQNVQQQQQQQQQPVHPMSHMMNGEKSEISCVRCRSHHRRCDKSIPTCMECLTRGYECVYQKPKKRGRKQKNAQAKTSTAKAGREPQSKINANRKSKSKSSDSSGGNSGNGNNAGTANPLKRSEYHPYAPSNGNQTATSSALPSSLTSGGKQENNGWAGQLMELYFQFTGRCPSLIERELLDNHLDDHIDATSNVSVERKAARALLNATQAVTLQRLGQKQDAQLMFEKTRELCLQADVYESHISNFHVAAAMITMAMWLVGERREAAAKMYLNNVYFYIEQLQEKKPDLTMKQTEEMNRLSITVGVVELMLSLNFFEYEEVERKATGTGGFCDLSISNHMQSKLKKRLEICKRVLSKNCFSEEQELNKLFDQIFETLCGVGEDTDACVMSLKRALDQFERIDECLQVKFKATPALLLSWSILFQGFKLELLADYEYRMVCNTDPAFLEKLEAIASLKRFVADNISRKILHHSTWFPLTCNLHIKYVVMTALIHVKHAGSIGKNYTEEEILAFLKADQWALETTQRRFNFPKSDELINNVKSCINIVSARRDSIMSKNVAATDSVLSEGSIVENWSPRLASFIPDSNHTTADSATFTGGNQHTKSVRSSSPDVRTLPIQFSPGGSIETSGTNAADSTQSVDINSEMERILDETSFDDFLNSVGNLNPPGQDSSNSHSHSPIDFMELSGWGSDQLLSSNLPDFFFE